MARAMPAPNPHAWTGAAYGYAPADVYPGWAGTGGGGPGVGAGAGAGEQFGQASAKGMSKGAPKGGGKGVAYLESGAPPAWGKTMPVVNGSSPTYVGPATEPEGKFARTGVAVGGGPGVLEEEYSSEEDSDFWLGHSEPDTARRRCTDAGWILPFALGIAGLVYLRVAGVPGADANIMRHLADYNKSLCGAGDFSDQPYLFFCLLENDGLDVHYPICRASCPTNSSTSYGCVRKKTTDNVGGPQGSVVMIPDYATERAEDMFCEPLDASLMKQMTEERKHLKSDPISAYLRMATKAWEPIVVAAVWALISASAFLGLLRYFASSAIWLGMTSLSIVPLGYGSLCLWCWRYDEHCHYVGDDLDKLQIIICGVGCISVGLLFVCFVTRQAHDIELAIYCIEWSVKCIMSCPSLFIHPVWVLATRIGVFVALQDVAIELMSLFHEDIITWKNTFQPLDVLLAFYFFFMVFWIMHYIASSSFFISMYVAEMWYFHGGLREEKVRTPACLALRGLWLALRYHQGTLIFGALCTGVTQPFKLGLAALTGVARMDENPVGRVAGAICCCLVAVYEGLLEMLSRNAYMDVAMSARPFCEATDITQAVLAADDVVHLLNGATWIFQLAGLGAIAVTGFMLTQVVVARGFIGDTFTDPMEDDFVYNTFAEASFGAITALFVAFPFMMLFDVVSDVVLFCHTVESLRQVEEIQPQDEGWMDGLRGYLTELTGCSCSLRPKAVGHPADGGQGSKRTVKRQQADFLTDDIGEAGQFRKVGNASGGRGSASGGGRSKARR